MMDQHNEGAFYWTREPVISKSFWSKGRIICAVVTVPWLIIALVVRFAF